jgi:hypothetical protein
VAVARREHFDETVEVGDDDVRIAGYDLAGKRGKALGAALGGITLDAQIASLDITEPAQRFVEPPYPERPRGLGELVGGDAGMDERNPTLLLRAPQAANSPPRRRQDR